MVDRAIRQCRPGDAMLPNGEIIERHGGIPGRTRHDGASLARLAPHAARQRHGFADSYLDGDWSTPELSQLLEFCMQNRSALSTTAAVDWLGLVRNRLVHWLRHGAAAGAISRRITISATTSSALARRGWCLVGAFRQLRHAGGGAEGQADRAAALPTDDGERAGDRLRLGRVGERLIRHYGFERLRHRCRKSSFPMRRSVSRPRSRAAKRTSAFWITATSPQPSIASFRSR
jgi:hypothetical protein